MSNVSKYIENNINDDDGGENIDNEDHPSWMSNGLTTQQSQNDRNENQDLKFQSKIHRNKSNYFGIDEYSGDFKNNKKCPGSELHYMRYFTTKLKFENNPHSNSLFKVNQLKSNHLINLGIREDNMNSTTTITTPKNIKRYRDTEVLVLPSGTRKLFQIKVFLFLFSSQSYYSPLFYSIFHP